ncbi:MAG: penicillin-binding protein 1A [Gammaproteobacteria bacterium]|nr:penicillin-binding protein 1A [Gammaproteobacteria bacterium]MCF6229362.1 penicillin-binding protein 1A [Gammaproteobacteria bacterium]
MVKKFIIPLLKLFFLLALVTALSVGAYIYFVVMPKLPSIDSVKEVQLQVPMRIYTYDHKLIAEYGEKKRVPLQFENTPGNMINAILAAEDDRFFKHPGVDYQGIMRALYSLALTGEKSQGGSTITMQVIRNYFLTREKTYIRKLNEILLSLKIEKSLSKKEILELYINKIFLGHRAYGFGAASHVYYGKPIDELTLPQMAMLAGLPKAPSAYNPISNMERATLRRNYVLRRMHQLGFITQMEYKQATDSIDDAIFHHSQIKVSAPYVAEMVRAKLYKQYGSDIYTQGMKVYTTLNSSRQIAANRALQNALLNYERRKGYRGPLDHIEIGEELEPEVLKERLSSYKTYEPLTIALVTHVGETSATLQHPLKGEIQIAWENLKWARALDKNSGHRGPIPKKATDILNVGDVIEVQQVSSDEWSLAQTPEIEGAFVALNPNSGAIQALVGGYDYYRSKFNRAFQGARQPGSNFKPFFYTAALDKGYTPATLINDAPVVFEDDALETTWRPENYSGKFFGPTRLREALIHSRNLVSIRVLQDIGIRYAINYSKRFGINTNHLPSDLSLALGSASFSPLEIATGYAVFANGGFKVEPYFISQVMNGRDELLYQASPRLACTDCLPDERNTVDTPFSPQAISPQTIYQISSILKDVVKRGTGRQALRLGRDDLHGKTGTTNDQFDAWFSGYSPSQVATAWVGFDQPRALGGGETGGRTALPMWIDYMEEALRGIPNMDLPQPPGMLTVRIDPVSGKLAHSGDRKAVFETFRAEHAPKEVASPPTATINTTTVGDNNADIPPLDEGADELF